MLASRKHSFAKTSKGEPLSPRELEVLEHIARGATNAQIAALFVISEDTVKSHVKHILQKLEVRNRTAAALYYVERYGLPASEDEQKAVNSQNGAVRERRARVVGLSANDRAVLRLEDGRAIEVSLLEAIRAWFDVGSPALVYLDEQGDPVGWYLPSADLGVDLRRAT